ncbi:hypothetical protein HRbin11_00200 [bacterium HR11]|nr:hypothetical protein HRbin11_00200 [bacterium HR11]
MSDREAEREKLESIRDYPATQDFTYEGNAFPWWLQAIWYGWLLWTVIYMVTRFWPDLKAWLTQPPIGPVPPHG